LIDLNKNIINNFITICIMYFILPFNINVTKTYSYSNRILVPVLLVLPYDMVNKDEYKTKY